jgi:hypothetical protein
MTLAFTKSKIQKPSLSHGVTGKTATEHVSIAGPNARSAALFAAISVGKRHASRIAGDSSATPVSAHVMKPATGELGLLNHITNPGPRPRTIGPDLPAPDISASVSNPSNDQLRCASWVLSGFRFDFINPLFGPLYEDGSGHFQIANGQHRHQDEFECSPAPTQWRPRKAVCYFVDCERVDLRRRN